MCAHKAIGGSAAAVASCTACCKEYFTDDIVEKFKDDVVSDCTQGCSNPTSNAVRHTAPLCAVSACPVCLSLSLSLSLSLLSGVIAGSACWSVDNVLDVEGTSLRMCARLLSSRRGMLIMLARLRCLAVWFTCSRDCWASCGRTSSRRCSWRLSCQSSTTQREASC
jgi:hypothetical protein